MKKYLSLLLALAFLISGCGIIGPQTSICDNINEQSYLCEVAASNDVRIEDVGNMLIVANAIAIGQDVYTMDQALKVVKDIRSAIDNPISYLAVRNIITDSTSKYPGLFIVASIYISQFDRSQIMYKKDRMILGDWLDIQIAMLGG